MLAGDQPDVVPVESAAKQKHCNNPSSYINERQTSKKQISNDKSTDMSMSTIWEIFYFAKI
jgi:hypothetical protein